jgi:hypothetical protein
MIFSGEFSATGYRLLDEAVIRDEGLEAKACGLLELLNWLHFMHDDMRGEIISTLESNAAFRAEEKLKAFREKAKHA